MILYYVNHNIGAFMNEPKEMGLELKELEERLKEARDKAQEFIRDYPLTSVAIGVGLGFLIGKMFSKK